MADSGNRLESNIVLKTTVPKPTGSGFKVTLSELDKIEKRLTDITSKTWTIRIKLDDRQARRLGIRVGDSGGMGGSLGGGITGTIGGRGTGLTGRSRTQRYSKEGELLGVTDKEIKEAVRGMEQFKNEVQETDGILRKSSASVTDLLEKERLRVDRLRASRKAASKVAREESQAMRVARQSGEGKVRANLASGNQEFAGVTGTERFAIRQQERDLNQQRQEARTQEEKRRALAIKDAERQQKEAQKRAADRARQRTRDAFTQQRVDAQQAAGHVAREERFRSGRAVRGRLSELQDQGYKVVGEGQQFNRSKGAFEDTIKLQRVSGNALQGYTVQQVNASIAGRRLNETTLTGAAAWRAVGDSITNAAAKVSVWLAATSLVFATIRGFQALANEIVKLSEGTILLARVGRNLGHDFEQRQAAAQRLTRDFLILTAAIGGNASEAQKAAAVFARAGYNEVEVLQAVKASLLAAQIAELDVVESAELLAAATFQFNQKAGDILPTLDLLNTYSNNYRVTTNDLLQAISRSGSVIAAQGGRISELGAITAVTSQVTARSGAEIGNAMKTIASNLDRVDTRQMILEKLGVSLNNLEGESKTYSEILLELDNASRRLSSTEKNQLSISIAGVRQRNILLAQMKNALAIVNAEVSTLLQEKGTPTSGDALTEYSQRVKSLGSTLERLQAEAVSAGVGLSSPFQELGKGVANTLALLLKLLNLYEGAPAKLAGWVAVLAAVTLALRYLNVQYGAATVATLRQIGATIAAIAADYTRTGSTLGLSLVMSQLTKATLAAVAANGPLLITAGLLTAAFFAASSIVSNYAEKLAVATAKEKAAADAADEGARSAQNKAQAYRIASTALTGYILRLEELQAAELSTGKNANRTQEIARVQADIQSLAKNAGVATTGTAEEIQQRLFDKELESRKKRAEFLKEQLQRERELEHLHNKEQATLGVEARLQRAGLRGRGEGAGPSGVFGELKEAADFFIKTNYLEAEVQKKEAKIFELRKESLLSLGKQESLEQDIAALEAGIQSDLGKQREHRKAIESLSRAQIQGERQRDRQPFTDAAREIFGGPRFFQQMTELQQSLHETESQYEVLRKLQEDFNTPPEDLKKGFDEFNKSLDRTNQLGLKLHQTFAASVQGEYGKRLGQAGNLRTQALLIASRRARSEARASGLTDPLAESNVTRTALFQNIQDNVRRRNEFAGLSRTSTNPETRASAAQGAVAANKQILEDTDRLRQLEIQHGITLLDVEQKIAAARKQSADEAARALGTLSDEDKLRVVAQAQYFAKNPGAKIGLGQQFLMDSASVGVGQRFFGSHFGELEPGSDPLSALLNKGGFGMTPDLARAQTEAATARGGLTDQQILQRAQAAANRAGQFGNQVAGNAAGNIGIPGIAPGGGNFDLRGNLQPKVDLNVNAQQIDFAPLMHGFEHAFIQIMDEKIVEMGKLFDETLSKRDRLKPKINVGAGAP